jgi:hypothetical protein
MMPDTTTSDAPTPDAPPETPADTAEGPQPFDNDKLEKKLKSQIEVSKTYRRKLTPKWKRNIQVRLGEPGTLSGSEFYEPSSSSDERQSLVNPDWSLTKTKTANLYSQVPQVQGTHENTKYAQAVAPFMKQLNYDIGDKGANFGPPMEECLNDVVNASGVAGVMVGYAARTQMKSVAVEEVFQSPTSGPVPTKDLPPDQLQSLAAAGLIHLQDVPEVVDQKFFCTRLSPGQLLWPKNFTGSNFDDADFRGYTGRLPWGVAKPEFKLTDDQKEKACSGVQYNTADDLRTDSDHAKDENEDYVTFDELYYWRYRYDPDELSFSAIWKIVFVHGIEKAVIHEPWKGQRYVPETRKYVGACKPPVRFLTLTYVTDHPVAPSDTAAGRPQVVDMRRSRSQMLDNRDRSRPLNWYDVNRIGTSTQALLNKGTWQGFIPTIGDGSRALGQVARASYPAEDNEFDRVTKSDLLEVWQIGPNQQGTASPSGTTATESTNVQANFATRIGQEKGRVAAFFLGAVEVLAGWISLYSAFPVLTDQERQEMESAWDRKSMVQDLVLKIRPDSQVVLDVGQQIDRKTKFLNIAGKSGVIDPAPVIMDIAELSGYDPMSLKKQPEPPPKEKVSISLRLSGKEDMVNPLVMAMLVAAGEAPSPEQLKEAQTILQAAAATVPPPQPPGMPGADGISSAPSGPNGSASPPGAPPPQGPQPPGAGHPPNWTLMDKVAKRSEDIGA